MDAAIERIVDYGDAQVQRKPFRVEQMFGARRAAATSHATGEHDACDQLKSARACGTQGALAGDNVTHELALMREVIPRNRAELAALIGDSKSRRMARAAGELGAAAEGMEKATHTILQAAETIDDSAKSLGYALKTEFERGLAEDIQERTVQIYEACNFQDLAGQRIAKVIGVLHTIEAQLAVMLARCDTFGSLPEAPAAGEAAEHSDLLNGPKLDGDSGHASQNDIDAMFN